MTLPTPHERVCEYGLETERFKGCRMLEADRFAMSKELEPLRKVLQVNIDASSGQEQMGYCMMMASIQLLQDELKGMVRK